MKNMKWCIDINPPLHGSFEKEKKKKRNNTTLISPLFVHIVSSDLLNLLSKKKKGKKKLYRSIIPIYMYPRIIYRVSEIHSIR